MAKSIDPVSLILAKAIKAIDLKVQRLQNETLVMQGVQQMAEQELGRLKLAEIAGWQQQLQGLYAGYFAELKQVKGVISNGDLVKTIVALHEQVQVEYRKFKDKAAHIALFNYSQELRRMLAAILSSQLSMKDTDRLTMLNTLRDGMFRCLDKMQTLNQQELALEEKRIGLKKDENEFKRLHGIQ